MQCRTAMMALWLVATSACVDSPMVSEQYGADVRMEPSATVQAEWVKLRFLWGLPYLLEDETRYLEVVGVDRAGRTSSDLPIKFSSSDASRIDVTSTGAVTGVRPGVVDVVARLGELETTLEVTVESADAEWIELSTDFVQLTWLEDAQLFATTYNNAETDVAAPVVWSSDDPLVATVDEGRVIAVSPGYTRVIATSGEVRAEVGVRVVSPPAAYIEIVSAPRTMRVGEQSDIDVVAVASDSRPIENARLLWQTNDAGIAWVDPSSGRIKGVGVGSTTLTVTSGNALARWQIVVNAAPSN